MSGLRLNGHPVGGHAALQVSSSGRKQLWAAITVGADNPTLTLVRQAVLANSLEMTLEGEAHDPATDAHFDFRAKGQLVNGRVSSNIRADFKSTEFVVVDAT